MPNGETLSSSLAAADLRRAIAALMPVARAAASSIKGTPPVLVLDLDQPSLFAGSARFAASVPVGSDSDLTGRLGMQAADLAKVAAVLSGRVTVSEAHKGVALSDGTVSAVVPKGDGADALKALDVVGSIEAPVAALLDWLARPHPTIAPEDNRYGLNGLHIETEPSVRAVATDGNRLTVAELAGATVVGSWPTERVEPTGSRSAYTRNRLIPRPAVAAMLTLLKRAIGTARLEWDARNVVLTCAGGWVRAALIEAEFPDYPQVIPKSWARTVDVDRDALMAGVRRVMWAARDHSTTIRCAFAPGAVTLSASYYDVSASTSVPIGLEGEPLTIGLNAAFVLAALKTLPPGPVVFAFGDKLGPTRFTSKVSPLGFVIVMPVRLD